MLGEYKNNLEIQKNRVTQKNAQDNVKKFYKQNKEDCEKAFLYYWDYNMNKNNYIDRPRPINKDSLLVHRIKIK